MKHDPFDFSATEMTWWDKAWRIVFLLAILAVLAYDLFIGRPG